MTKMNLQQLNHWVTKSLQRYIDDCCAPEKVVSSYFYYRVCRDLGGFISTVHYYFEYVVVEIPSFFKEMKHIMELARKIEPLSHWEGNINFGHPLTGIQLSLFF